MDKREDTRTSGTESEWRTELDKKNSVIGRLERELKIEAALERVRARTMGMQKSDELAETVSLLFTQLIDLGIRPSQMRTCAIVTLQPDQPVGECWITTPDGHIIPQSFIVPYDETSAYKDIYAAWKQGEKFLVVHLSGEALTQHLEFLKKYAKIPAQQFRPTGDQPTETFTHAMFFSRGYLFVISNEPLLLYHDVFKRIGKVFEQTYTRFLDLKKAEEQTREAQIEAALERVRSRAMAMQNSNELGNIVDTVFKELTRLHFSFDRCIIMIFDPETNGSTWWLANPEPGEVPVGLFVKYSEHTPYLDQLNAWRSRILKWQYLMEGNNKKEWDGFLFTETDLSLLPEVVITGMKSIDSIFLNTSFNNFGCLMVSSVVPFPDEHFDILLRFAKVFDSTYTRFNDLKKAESQAREAQIEAALERVRSRTMAMQRSDELAEVALSLFQQVKELGIEAWAAGFNIWADDNLSYVDWMTGPTGDFMEPYTVDVTSHPVFRAVREARETGSDFFVSLMEAEQCREVYHLLKSFTNKGQYQKILDTGIQFPARQYNHFVFGKQVSLLFITYEPLPEAWDIFKRFGKVFEQTYTRFLDLQKAEALTRETVQRASVDRIRAEIASMRTTADLNRITPLIWNELTTIGVPFVRCGVFIMDEEQKQINIFLSTPEGKGVAASFHLPCNASQETTEIVTHWNRKEMYRPHWDEAAFIDFTRVLAEQGAITSGEKFLVESRPNDLYLHFIPFLQGMLYVGDTAPLCEEHLQLVKALAEAFSTAYSRYEDFNKLESAKIQIEKTLVDLKQAQSQLVQAEKMASLGELTAGIAHEIQNPLNFVNNFSEVNQELIAEMREELLNGNMEGVAEMARQIGDNEGKILHHGKRADAIVKSMLQHSRTSTNTKELTNVNTLADEYLRLAYHGMRSKDKSFNAAMQTDFDSSIGLIPLIPQDIGRVLLNLNNNAFYAVHEKKKTAGKEYEPAVTVTTKKTGAFVEIKVRDNGNGIPQKLRAKIFQPFFTTKPTGQGTGLGLSLSYDIIKAHGGEVKVDTNEGEFTEFIIQIPLV